MASGSLHAALTLTNLHDGTVSVQPKEHDDAVTAVAFSADGRYVASGSADASVKLWRTDTGEVVQTTFGATLATYAIFLPIQLIVHAATGHYLIPKSMHGILGVGISALSIAFVCLNPFFEELIVRGYLMTELFELGGSGVLAIVISTLVQMSYHLYQGFANGIVLTTVFAVFSIYFWKTVESRPWFWRTFASMPMP